MLALIDSGASANFISERVASELQLRRHKSNSCQPFTIANGDNVPCTQFVHIYIQMSSAKFDLTLRIAPMHPDLILGAPFLVRFNPLIDWQARHFRIIRKDGPHRISIVSKHSSDDLDAISVPPDHASSASYKGIPFPEREEPQWGGANMQMHKNA